MHATHKRVVCQMIAGLDAATKTSLGLEEVHRHAYRHARRHAPTKTSLGSEERGIDMCMDIRKVKTANTRK